jgi:hypothetical protein
VAPELAIARCSSGVGQLCASSGPIFEVMTNLSQTMRRHADLSVAGALLQVR